MEGCSVKLFFCRIHEIVDCSDRVTLNFDRRPRIIIEKLCHVPIIDVCHLKATREFKLEFSSGNPQSEPNRRFVDPCDLEIWRMTPKNNGAPLLSHRSPVNYTPKGPVMRTLILLWCESAAFFSLLALCAGNSPVTGEFLSQKVSNADFDVSLMWVSTNCWTKIEWLVIWFLMTSMWRHRNGEGEAWIYGLIPGQ